MRKYYAKDSVKQKKYKRTSVSPVFLLITLAGLVIAGFIVKAIITEKQDLRSKASYNSTDLCLSACDKLRKKDACKANCPGFIAGDITAAQICRSAGVTIVTKTVPCPPQPTGSSVPAENYDFEDFVLNELNKLEEPLTTSQNIRMCVKSPLKRCARAFNMIKNPCTEEGVCKETGAYTDTCIASCTEVLNEAKTCDVAFTNNPAFNTAPQTVVQRVTNLCKKTFETP